MIFVPVRLDQLLVTDSSANKYKKNGGVFFSLLFFLFEKRENRETLNNQKPNPSTTGKEI